jgi:hypothetical protein
MALCHALAGASIVSPMNGGAARPSCCEHDDAPGHSAGVDAKGVRKVPE